MITQENIPYTADEIKAMVKTCEKYNKALERAQQFSEHPLQEDSADIVEYIFPELKESQDERMKKAIMHVLYENYTDAAVIEGVEIAEIIAWLEEQGKKMSADEVMNIRRELYQSGYNDGYKHGQEDKEKELYKQLIEKQGKKLDPDEVIAWIVANICDFEYYVKLFKKDFKL